MAEIEEQRKADLQKQRQKYVEQGILQQDASDEQVEKLLEQAREAEEDRLQKISDKEDARVTSSRSLLHNEAIDDLEAEVFHKQCLLSGFSVKCSEEGLVAALCLSSWLATDPNYRYLKKPSCDVQRCRLRFWQDSVVIRPQEICEERDHNDALAKEPQHSGLHPRDDFGTVPPHPLKERNRQGSRSPPCDCSLSHGKPTIVGDRS